MWMWELELRWWISTKQSLLPGTIPFRFLEMSSSLGLSALRLLAHLQRPILLLWFGRLGQFARIWQRGNVIDLGVPNTWKKSQSVSHSQANQSVSRLTRNMNRCMILEMYATYVSIQTHRSVARAVRRPNLLHFRHVFHSESKYLESSLHRMPLFCVVYHYFIFFVYLFAQN